MQVTTVGLDLAKNIFQVHGIKADGTVAFNKSLRRTQLLQFFENPDRAMAYPLQHRQAAQLVGVLIGQLDDIIGQPLFIGTPSRCLALRRSMLAKRAEGAALGHAQFLPHMVNTFPAT